jgi:hypothetical protein
MSLKIWVRAALPKPPTVQNNLLQELTATRKIGLRQLLSDNGEKFEKGRAFYQLTKPEIIQAQAFSSFL